MEKVILELNLTDPFVDLSCPEYKLVISYENHETILMNGQRPIISNNIVVQHDQELHLFSNGSTEIIPKPVEPENIITALILHHNDDYRFVLLVRSTHNTILVLRKEPTKLTENEQNEKELIEQNEQNQFKSVNKDAIITTEFMFTFNSVRGLLFRNGHLYVYNGTMLLKCKATVQDYVQCFTAFRKYHQNTVQGPEYSIWKSYYISLVRFTANNTITLFTTNLEHPQVFQL